MLGALGVDLSMLNSEGAERERKLAYMREWHQKKREADPEWLEKRRAYARTYREANRARERENRAKRLASNPNSEREYTRRYTERHRERKRAAARADNARRAEEIAAYYRRPEQSTRESARRKLRRAVQSGKIVKPTHCPGCQQETPKHRMHGHHADYAKPYDVEWLCSICHGKKHRKS